MGTMYYGRAVVLLLWIFCSSVISKPTNEDGQNGNPVVNMNADGEQGNGNPNPDRGSEILDNKSPDNPLAGQENNAPANGEKSAQDNQERNIHVNQDSSLPASQEHNPISNQDSDRQTNLGGNTAANEGTDHQNERQQSDVHNQVTDNENPQKSAVQQTEEVDWGHADTANVMMRLSINQEQNEQTEQQQHTDQQQQAQQQLQAQQQQQSEQQQQTQQEVPTDKTEIAHEASESTQQDHTGEQTNAGHDIGVLEPEHVLHGDDGHGDHHAGAENATSIKEQEEARVQDAQERIAVEKQEMEDVQPKVVGSNVHDSLSRRIAEFVKDKQFSPENAEEAIHGGHHVHEEKDGGRPKDVQTGNVESIVHGEDGVHDDHHKKDDKGPLTVDPEQMMHAGQGDDHPHDRHENEPVGESPNGTLLSDNNRRTKNQSQNNQGDFGIDLEPIVHEGEHVHGKAGSQKSRNKVRYQDIIELGLSQELLKGIDLSKLLEQEKKEMEAWQHDKNERNGMSEEDNSETEQNALFWQKQVTELRKTYLEKLYAKVRHLSNPEPDSAQSQGDQNMDNSKAKEAMEKWANTVSTGNKKHRTSNAESSQKNEEVLQEVANTQSEHEEAAIRAKYAGDSSEKNSNDVAEENRNTGHRDYQGQDVGEENAQKASEDDL